MRDIKEGNRKGCPYQHISAPYDNAFAINKERKAKKMVVAIFYILLWGGV
jgi:hypothetical protein